MTQRFNGLALFGAALILIFASAAVSPAITEIVLPGKTVFPESITSTADGS
jgi:hypothetical protein